jgi:hypothetical protein
MQLSCIKGGEAIPKAGKDSDKQGEEVHIKPISGTKSPRFSTRKTEGSD